MVPSAPLELGGAVRARPHQLMARERNAGRSSNRPEIDGTAVIGEIVEPFLTAGIQRDPELVIVQILRRRHRDGTDRIATRGELDEVPGCWLYARRSTAIQREVPIGLLLDLATKRLAARELAVPADRSCRIKGQGKH